MTRALSSSMPSTIGLQTWQPPKLQRNMCIVLIILAELAVSSMQLRRRCSHLPAFKHAVLHMIPTSHKSSQESWVGNVTRAMFRSTIGESADHENEALARGSQRTRYSQHSTLARRTRGSGGHRVYVEGLQATVDKIAINTSWARRKHTEYTL